MRKFLLLAALPISVSAFAFVKGNTEQLPKQSFEAQATVQTVADLTLDDAVEADDIEYAPTVKGDTSVFYTLDKSLYIFFNANNSVLSGSFAYNPAYHKVKLTNRSSDNVSDLSWTYADYAKTIYYVKDEKNYYQLVDTTIVSDEFEMFGVPGGLRYPYPTLSAGDVTYDPMSLCGDQAYFVFGPRVTSAVSAKDGYAYYASPTCLFLSPKSGSFSNCEIRPKVETTNATLKKYITTKYSDATNICTAGIGQLFPAQPTNYYFDEIIYKFTASDTIIAGASVHASIYSVADNEPDYITEKTLIGEADFTFDKSYGAGNTYRYMTLKVKEKDPVTGLYSEGLIVPANTRILILIDSLKDMAGFKPLFFYTAFEQENGKNLTYSKIYSNNVYFYMTSDKGDVLRRISFYATNSGYPYNTMMAINATFDYLYSATPNLEIPETGGSVTAQMDAFYRSSSWDIEEDPDQTGTIDGWLKYTIDPGINYYGKESDWAPVITFEAGKTTAPRKATMSIYSPEGGEFVFTVSQGNSGVGAVAVEAVAVKSVGGNFEVVVPASVSNVAVYNVAGQKVADVNVTAGANTIDGSALANGVYVLKFNNGYTVKAVK